jgi:hypothetical protein
MMTHANHISAKIITKFVHPPIPDRSRDWSAHFEGREEWLIGRGQTEQSAIVDLYAQAAEKDALGAVLQVHPHAYIWHNVIERRDVWSVWTGDGLASGGLTGMLSASDVSEEDAVAQALAKLKSEGLLKEERHGW